MKLFKDIGGHVGISCSGKTWVRFVSLSSHTLRFKKLLFTAFQFSNNGVSVEIKLASSYVFSFGNSFLNGMP